MRAKLEFNLPEDQAAFDDAIKAQSYKAAIKAIHRALSNVYYDPHSEQQANLVKKLREQFEAAVKDLGIFQ
jgi:hypothetical protein